MASRSGARFANLAVLMTGAGLLVVGLGGHAPRWSPPPVPPVSAAAAATAEAPPAAEPPRRRFAGMGRSVPVTVTIPAIAVHAHIIALGQERDGTIAVPSLSTPFVVGWFDRGSAPGQAGPAVLLGHVDAASVGPAVFYRLGDLRPGDLIYITRRDHRMAVFRVTSVGLYPETAFPATRVYGSTRGPSLRLITCGGQFNWATHLYLDRIVVFADFAGSRHL